MTYSKEQLVNHPGNGGSELTSTIIVMSNNSAALLYDVKATQYEQHEQVSRKQNKRPHPATGSSYR